MAYIYCILLVALLQCTSLIADIFDNEINSHQNNKNHENTVEEGFVDSTFEPSPCQLITTPYGCCWDQKTLAFGPNGKGCPVCKDHQHMKCRKWKQFCSDSEIVRENCPKSCGVCGHGKELLDAIKVTCEDNKAWKSHCNIYKQLNFCRIPEIAEECKLTCNQCGGKS